MGFSTYEQSNTDGRPIKFYAFRWGNSYWYYTSADEEKIVDGNTYVPIAIGDEGLTQGTGAEAKEFNVNMPALLDDGAGGTIPTPVVVLFRGTPPSEPVYLTVRKKHEQDPETPIEWIGKIVNVVRTDEGANAKIVCRNPGLKRTGLRLTWCRECPHFVFDTGCALDKTLYAVTRNITALTGNSITVDGAALTAAPYFNGGFIEWDADGLGTIERRGIEKDLGGNELQLFGRSDGLSIGQAVTMYPGCDGSAETCETKFNNLPNYGGVDFMPGKSPFDGRQVF
jgi:uncharacterized phage protein (TIGR02218 family)